MEKKLPSVSINIESLTPYKPGKPIEELQRELGITDIIKLASNECSLGPSPKALQAITEALPKIYLYPDGAGYELRSALAEHHNLSLDRICLGNGSNEIIEFLCRTFMQPGDEALAAAPSFLMYSKLVQVAGGVLAEIPLDKNFRLDLSLMLEAITERTKIIFVNNPNNPAGTILYKDEVHNFLEKVPSGVIVVFDEAYIDFADDPNCAYGEEYLTHSTPVVVMRTFSKIAGLAGLRIGYALAAKEIISLFDRVRQPFNTSLLAQAAAKAALSDKVFRNKYIELVHTERHRYYEAFEKWGLFYLKTQANFILVQLGKQAVQMQADMLKRGVIVRQMDSYGLPDFLRITIGLPEENIRCLKSLHQVMKIRGA